jgi:Tfp pilus assembly PilM family ATPase
MRKKSWVRSAFPVPRSLILSDVSLDVSDGTLRYFEFARSRGRLRPRSWGASPFPRIHIGASDEKLKAEAIAALSAWSKERKVRAIRAVIHEDEAYVFKVTMPTADPAEIRPAIEALLEENVPIPPSDAIFEYDIIACDPKLGETTAAVTVLSQKSVSEYLDLFGAAGLDAISLDTESRSLARALFAQSDTGVHAVLAIAERHSIVFIVERGSVVFSSSLEVGSRDLDRAIAKTLGLGEEEARKLKDEKAFAEEGGDMKLFEAMLPVFSTIRDELSKVIVFWKAQAKKERDFKDIEDVVLTGSDSLIVGFSRYVSLTSKTSAKIASVWTNVLSTDEALPMIAKNESLDYGAVIGNLL